MPTSSLQIYFVFSYIHSCFFYVLIDAKKESFIFRGPAAVIAFIIITRGIYIYIYILD